MELVFSKVAACNFDLLNFLKQGGGGGRGSVRLFISSKFSGKKTSMSESIFNKVQAAGFNTNSSKLKF